MPDRHVLAGVQQALAAIDVMLRSGRTQPGQLAALAQEARSAAELAQQRMAKASAAAAEPSADPKAALAKTV
ncbi:hypothetical protein E8L99_04780 [Phreatobacter aquaticus]|uniref:Uncharacterized protein n=1 Tax=Phreatobacter aquaticus TaxID=2570229 RepID=A0A4D7QEX2_9HYPH|nr:hypothetical protein [Phreatobacter aquaticus]QCK85141.1 hypothetical protein E8L99_04780 [Phreatobacter aquaticus]